jgi:lysophospholipase L1-like esterase
MDSPLRASSYEVPPRGATVVVAGLPARLFGGLLLGVAVAFGAAGAHAAPLITGCCDSLTAEATFGYLPLITDDVYGAVNVDDEAVGARKTAGSLIALTDYLGLPGDGVDPDVVVVLAGTTDPFWVTGINPLVLDATPTANNVEAMVVASVADGSTPIVVAPPPVLAGCPQPVTSGLNCAQIDTYLFNLRPLLAGIAASRGVPFVDLYTIFEEYLPYEEPYEDGVHLDGEGDEVVAQAVVDELGPMVGAPCEDGVDNDGDTYIDFPADIDCDDPSDWSEGAAVLECEDGVDNDADGATDLDDFGCHGRGDFSERTAPDVIACDDGVDNDGDGTSDFLGDAGCGTPLQMNESPKCNDGRDNDGDGLIDFDGGQWVWGACTGLPGGCPPEVSDPDEDGVADPDPHCTLASIDRESPGLYCGLGFEVSLLLAPLMWWRSRRAARR